MPESRDGASSRVGMGDDVPSKPAVDLAKGRSGASAVWNLTKRLLLAFGHRRGQRTDSSPVPEPRHLIDALRRSTELLDGMEPSNGTVYWREEREYIVAVNRRLLREHDPSSLTDRAAR